MKMNIAITLIVTIAVFSFVSGYSISTHNKMYAGSKTTVVEKTESSGGYGSTSSEKAGSTATSSPGYGQ